MTQNRADVLSVSEHVKGDARDGTSVIHRLASIVKLTAGRAARVSHVRLRFEVRRSSRTALAAPPPRRAWRPLRLHTRRTLPATRGRTTRRGPTAAAARRSPPRRSPGARSRRQTTQLWNHLTHTAAGLMGGETDPRRACIHDGLARTRILAAARPRARRWVTDGRRRRWRRNQPPC